MLNNQKELNFSPYAELYDKLIPENHFFRQIKEMVDFSFIRGRPFEPHLTVANRDIPAGVMTDALQVMNELNLVEDFPVDNVTIFERHGGKWVSVVSLELNC